MRRTRLLPQTAQALIDKGREHDSLEPVDDGSGVWVHGYDCPGYCDYACGAAFVHLGPDGKPTGEVET